MKWFRKTFMWASVGCLGAAASVAAQDTVWRATPGDSAEVRPAPTAVTLGRPTPIAPETMRVVQANVPADVAPSTGVQRASYVVRGAGPTAPDEPKGLFLPKDLPPLDSPKTLPSFQPLAQPAQAIQPPAKDKLTIIDIGADDKAKVVSKKAAAPTLTSPPIDPTERIIILPEGSGLGDEQGRSLFGLVGGGERRLHVTGEFLAWTARGFHIPPLVTTAQPGDDPNTIGALGFGTTRLIYGNTNLGGSLRPGARITLGYDVDPCGLCTIEASFFFLSQKNDAAFFSSTALPVIGRPFFNINTGLQDRELTSHPAFSTGNLQVNSSTSLWGAELNKRVLLWGGCDFELTGLVGFRYLDLKEHLRIEENSFLTQNLFAPGAVVPAFFAGDHILTFDRFDTHNRFYGGQVGVSGEWRRGPWSFDARVKLALGATRQSVDIDGGQRFDRANGAVQNFPGGLYALPNANIGHFAQTRFAVVPEVGVKLGYNFTDSLRVFVGYDFLYWSSVLRPGDQIDTALDANKIPNFGGAFPAATQSRPAVPFRTSSYWALGLNAGVEWRY